MLLETTYCARNQQITNSICRLCWFPKIIESSCSMRIQILSTTYDDGNYWMWPSILVLMKKYEDRGEFYRPSLAQIGELARRLPGHVTSLPVDVCRYKYHWRHSYKYPVRGTSGAVAQLSVLAVWSWSSTYNHWCVALSFLYAHVLESLDRWSYKHYYYS